MADDRDGVVIAVPARDNVSINRTGAAAFESVILAVSKLSLPQHFFV